MSQDIHSFIYRSRNDEVKKRSSSGAAFFELAQNAISKGCFVAGCVWDSNLQAKHIVSNKEQDIIRMQGSKYVQSNMNDTYKDILNLLKKNQKVLFSGTPCQASGISGLAYQIGKRENLITVAIICHGVPSPLAWESYKKWDELVNGDKLVDVNFRDKTKKGYKETYTKYSYVSGKEIFRPAYLPVNKYVESGIVYNLSMRPSCAECTSKGYNPNIDIILGDWHSDYSGEGYLGTSCISCYTNTGYSYVLESLKDLSDIKYEEVVEKNGCIEKSSKKNPNRDKFFKHIQSYQNWNTVEKLYPNKYGFKKLLYKIGLYNLLKGKI